MSSEEHRRALKILTVVFAAAIASSLVHYTDNYLAFDRFPLDEPGPRITSDSVWIAWIGFTAFGLPCYLLYRRGRNLLASALLAVYSLSGLIGIGHYTAPGMSELAWWRHLHIGVDILAGIAVMAFAVCSLRRTRRRAHVL